VLAAWAERDAAQAALQRVADQNDRLRHLLRQLQRMQFGRHSEKRDRDQLSLAIEELEQAIAAGEAPEEKADPAVRKARAQKRRNGRGALPEHLPRVEVVIAPEDMACPCCGRAMHVIGEDRSQRLDVISAQYQVIVTRRPKYACRACAGAVVQAAAPAWLIEGRLGLYRRAADRRLRRLQEPRRSGARGRPRSCSPIAGRIADAATSTSPRVPRRRSPTRPSIGSPRFMRSRRQSAARMPTTAEPSARKNPSRSSTRLRPGSTPS
jgi:transposase